MSGTAPANQLRLSFTGSEDGEAETETCRAAKPLWRTTTRTSGPRGLNSLNRRMRTRLYGGVGGVTAPPIPITPCRVGSLRVQVPSQPDGGEGERRQGRHREVGSEGSGAKIRADGQESDLRPTAADERATDR